MDNSETLLQDKSSRDDSIDYHKLSGILNYKIEDNQIRFNFKYASLVIRFLTADIFRIIMANSKQQFNYKSTEAVIDHNLSYNDFEFEENNKELIIKTEKLVIKIQKEKFFLQVFNKEGKLIHQDYSKYSLGW